jgi:hypothetical protein
LHAQILGVSNSLTQVWYLLEELKNPGQDSKRSRKADTLSTVMEQKTTKKKGTRNTVGK